MEINEHFKEDIERKIFTIPLWSLQNQENTNKFIAHIQFRLTETWQKYDDLLNFLKINYPDVFLRIDNSWSNPEDKDYEILYKKNELIREVYKNAKDLYKI